MAVVLVGARHGKVRYFPPEDGPNLPIRKHEVYLVLELRKILSN